MLQFIKPDYKVNEYVESNYYGKFVLEPLERGFGATIGNALRRVMLSSLEGSAITDIKIDGVMHEFQKIDGVVEDVTEIILNLKKLVLKNHSEEDQVLYLKANEEGVFNEDNYNITAKGTTDHTGLCIIKASSSGSIIVDGQFSKSGTYMPLFVDRKSTRLNSSH